MSLLGQQEEVIELAQLYINYLLPGIFLYMQFECSRRYLFCQGEYKSIMYVMLFTSIIH